MQWRRSGGAGSRADGGFVVMHTVPVYADGTDMFLKYRQKHAGVAQCRPRPPARAGSRVLIIRRNPFGGCAHTGLGLRACGSTRTRGATRTCCIRVLPRRHAARDSGPFGFEPNKRDWMS